REDPASATRRHESNARRRHIAWYRSRAGPAPAAARPSVDAAHRPGETPAPPVREPPIDTEAPRGCNGAPVAPVRHARERRRLRWLLHAVPARQALPRAQAGRASIQSCRCLRRIRPPCGLYGGPSSLAGEPLQDPVVDSAEGTVAHREHEI